VLIEKNRGRNCLNIGRRQIDDAIAQAFIARMQPAKMTGTPTAAERLEEDREGALKQWRLAVDRASYEPNAQTRPLSSLDPDNVLVARGLERRRVGRRLEGTWRRQSR